MNSFDLAMKTVWNPDIFNELRILIKKVNPQIVHFHNTFPLVSPSGYYAAHSERVPVVQTLHNYRILCLNALLFRKNLPCDLCIGRTPPWPGVIYKCYRKDRIASSVVAIMLTYHRMRLTWQKHIDIFIALSDFAKRKFVQGGIPAEKIVIKPNFIYRDPGIGNRQGSYFLYVGRLESEKGIETLLATWRQVGEEVSLKIIGEGPFLDQTSNTRLPIGVDFLGTLPNHQVIEQMKNATALIFPSKIYEGMPMSIIEAFAVGLPVIASRIGSMTDLIEDYRTGLLFNPGDELDLATKINWALSHPFEMDQVGHAARREFENLYSSQRNYELLIKIYTQAIAQYSDQFSIPGVR